MSAEDAPAEVMWAGKFVRAIRKGKWEYASRANDIRAVVKRCVDAMPTHQAFIDQNCAAPIPAAV